MTADNPWKTLSQRTVYDNPWIRVEDHVVLNPAGRHGQYGKICFKSQAVVIAALEDDGSVYLVGQHRYTLGSYSWELPKGGAPLTEDLLAAAQRELREETGLVAKTWRQLLRVHISNSVTDEVGTLFVAQDLEQGPAQPEETEQLVIRRVPFAEAVKRVRAGEITDVVSVAAILQLATEQLAAGRALDG
jgi:8-oxo-dGTP pyrophosphatase MutT (NUDIX family)